MPAAESCRDRVFAVIAMETLRADGLRHGGRLLVPVSRTVTVRFPGRAGGLVWNRPVAVEIRGPGGWRSLSVPDPTRRLQWLLLGAGAAAGILLRISSSLKGDSGTIVALIWIAAARKASLAAKGGQ
jgi:hypothetical protein